jgi:hypothetical protein
MIKLNTNTNSATNNNSNNNNNTTKTDNNLKELNAVRSLTSSSSSSSLVTSSSSSSSSSSLSSSTSFTNQIQNHNNKLITNQEEATPNLLIQKELKSIEKDVNNLINTINTTTTITTTNPKLNQSYRSQSEPPLVCHSNLATSRFLFDSISNRLSILNQILIDESPTIKLLFDNIKKRKYSNSRVHYRSSSLFLKTTTTTTTNESRKKSLDLLKNKKNNKISIQDLINNFSCSMLVFKRSFSYTHLKYEQKYIKKSSSFEKFLQNVVKGKQKSISMCNFNHSSNEKQQNLQSKQKSVINNNNKRDTSLPRLIRSASITSNESDNIDQMMMMIMNTTNKTNWPILKIDDSIKGSTNDLEVNLQMNDDSKENNNIPTNVRDALESAGIDIKQIIDMTNQLEMSFNELDSNLKTSKIENKTDLTTTTTTKTITSFHSFEINKNINAKITNNIESTNSKKEEEEEEEEEDDVLKEKYLIKNDLPSNNETNNTSQTASLIKPKSRSNRQRIGMPNRRYATMSSFTLPGTFSPHTFKTISTLDDLDTIKEHNTINKSNSNESTIDFNEENNNYSPLRRLVSSNNNNNNNRLVQSPSWASDFGASCSSPLIGNSTKILPAKHVSQFKPTLNVVHKRTSTMPITSIKQLVKPSSSIDSFLNSNETQSVSCKTTDITNLKSNESISINLDTTQCSTPFSIKNNETNETSPEQQQQQQQQNIDLTKSLPNRNRKKSYVTRSLSYNIGNLTGSLTEDKNNRLKTILNNNTSKKTMEPAASASANVKNKASFSLIEAFSRSQSSKINNKSTKEIANSNTNSKMKTSSNRISLLINNNNTNNESVSPLFLIPGSMSSSDLQCSTSSLHLALAANSTDDEGLKIIANEFHHVSIARSIYLIFFFLV